MWSVARARAGSGSRSRTITMAAITSPGPGPGQGPGTRMAALLLKTNPVSRNPSRLKETLGGSVLFGKYLLLTNTLTSGILMAAGDLIQQEIEYRNKIIDQRYEWDRVGRMFLIGLLQGSPQHWFYGVLDKFLPGTALKTIGKKIVIDQLIASPFCILIFFYGMGLMEGKNVDGCTNEIKEKFPTVYIADWCIWPPSQFINFYFVPNHYRVLYINGVTALYNVFLSYIKHVDYHHDKSSE